MYGIDDGMDGMKMRALEVRDLSVRYGNVTVLEGISMDVEQGDLLGILGPNGAGKTTLFNSILMLQEHEGTVGIFGYTNSARRSMLPFIGYLPQRFSIDQNFPATVDDLISTGLVSLKYMQRSAHLLERNGYRWDYDPGMSNRERMDEALRMVGLEHARRKRLGMLSGGELQRALIAKILVSRPLMLILDEPFTALDQDAQARLLNILKVLNEEMGVTIIVAAHDLMLLMKLAKSIACIDRRLFFHGSKDECIATDLMKVYSEHAMHMHMREHADMNVNMRMSRRMDVDVDAGADRVGRYEGSKEGRKA
ncbi:MAG: metal ABC transporter ATP-binding protein [Candidatus Nitrosocaldus sp.]|nr:metal ABC transporter ATP-binding protein [Candidatus Nitrosocaldus sp.]